MNEPLDRVDELFEHLLADATPAHVEQRLHRQLADFRGRLAQRTSQRVGWAFKPSQRAWLGATGAAAAVALVAIVIALHLRTAASFADVVAAVQRIPWIHVAITDPKGKTREVWYSAKDDASASRSEDWIEYHDHGLKIYYSYDMGEQVLYRVPEYTPRRSSEYAMIAESLRLLLRSGKPPEKPLERLQFLGGGDAKPELLEQTLDRVNEDGQQWLDYRLTVRYSQIPEPVRWLFRVDPETMLPRMSRVEGKWEGKPTESEQRFDYPVDGPASIYELGVPRTTKLVDRVPSDDIVRILDTLRAGRRRMDDYRAIVVDRMDDPGYPWWLNLQPLVLYRKGDKTRSDWLEELPKLDQPIAHADLEKWLHDRLKDAVSRPVYITEGTVIEDIDSTMTYHVETDVVTDTDGKSRLEVLALKSWRSITKPGEVFPPYWSRSPELVCRPPLGIPSQEMEPLIDTSPADGPKGTILLRIARTGRMPRAPHPANLPPLPDAYRNWLDPARDFVAVRHDMLGVDDTGKEITVSSYVIEELKQSPRGIWYATRFRVKAVPPVEHDEVFDVFIDFDVEISDRLFEVPRVGQVLAEYRER
jgi:hypothetical protein